MDQLPSPTPRELELLKVLWEHGPRSVAEVHKLWQPAGEKSPALNTVQTLLRIMETKGLVTHDAEGRAFIYRPMYSRDESAARFLDRVFDGAASQLVLSLLKSEKIPPGELEALRAMIQAERSGKEVRHD